MVDDKVKVLHLLLSLETGGMERFVYEHCLAIDNIKFDVSVCCIDRLGGFSDSLKQKGIIVDLLQKNQNRFDYIFPYKLCSYIKNKKIDVLHIHSGAFFYGSIAGFMARTKKIIYTEHGRHYIEPRIIYILDQISSFFCSKIVTVSPELQKYLIEKIRLPKNKITTIINGVNTREFCLREKSEKVLEELGIPPHFKVVGSVGRLVEIKDYFSLLKAYAKVAEQLPNSKLVLVGEGACLEDLKEVAQEFDILDSVVFAGNRSDVSRVLNIFDVFVLPSLLEGTSFSLLEAMASGVPVVVTNVGGNPSIVRDGYNGYLVAPKDIVGLSEKILNLLKNRGIAQEFSEKGIVVVKERYSLDRNIESYIKIYLQ